MIAHARATPLVLISFFIEYGDQLKKKRNRPDQRVQNLSEQNREEEGKKLNGMEEENIKGHVGCVSLMSIKTWMQVHARAAAAGMSYINTLVYQIFSLFIVKRP